MKSIVNVKGEYIKKTQRGVELYELPGGTGGALTSKYEYSV